MQSSACKLIATVLLSMLAACATTTDPEQTVPASAEWVRYAESDSTVFYYDPVSVRTNGVFRRVWSLSDLKERDPDGELSTVILEEYDCTEKWYRQVYLSSHSENMGRGTTILRGHMPENRYYVAPWTIADAILQIVCANY